MLKALISSMSLMRKRRFFFVSVALGIIAIGLQVGADFQFGRATYVTLGGTLPSQGRAARKLEAAKYLHRGEIIAWVGFAVAATAIGFIVASARRYEPAWRPLPVMLLLVYAILQFLLV